MVYRRGQDTVQVELANLQSFAEDADVTLRELSQRVDQLESHWDKIQGSLKVLVWMNGIVMSLVVLLIGALFVWGLNHITIRAVASPMITSSEISPPQDTSLPSAYVAK